jgi:hypothetical protein
MKIGAASALHKFVEALEVAGKQGTDPVQVPRWAADDARSLLKILARHDEGHGAVVFIRLKNGQIEGPDGEQREPSRPFVLTEERKTNPILYVAQEAGLTEAETIALLHREYCILQTAHTRYVEQSAQPVTIVFSTDPKR